MRLRKIKEREREGGKRNRLFIGFGFLTSYFAKWHPNFLLEGEGVVLRTTVKCAQWQNSWPVA